MKKVVINKCYGGFGLSEKAVMRYAELKGIKLYRESSEAGSGLAARYYLCEPEEYNEIFKEAKRTGNYKQSNAMYFNLYNIERDDPILVQVVEELGEEVNDDYSELKIVEIPSDLDYEISDYDGVESIHERHSVWG